MELMSGTHDYIPFEIDNTLYAVPMGNVGYILSTAEQFPHCKPPHMPPHVCCVIKNLNDLVTIIEVGTPEKSSEDCVEVFQRPLILVLHWSGHLIGLLVDHIGSPIKASATHAPKSSIQPETIVEDNGTDYLPFDVSRFVQNITTAEV